MPSGDETVVLAGPAMVRLVRAIEALHDAGVGRYAVVGGVAVTARLGRAHRATADVDTVVDDTTPPDAIEALLALPGADADPTQDHRVWIDGTKVELLRVEPIDESDLDGIPDSDALFVASHTWALDTATPLTVIAGDDRTVRATAPFATPAGLLAMKVHAIETRSAGGLDKRGGDAADLYRLLVDLDADGALRTALAAAPPALRRLVVAAVDRILVTGADRTAGWLRAGSSEAVRAEELRALAEPVLAALR
jgi:hypothetical protein